MFYFFQETTLNNVLFLVLLWNSYKHVRMGAPSWGAPRVLWGAPGALPDAPGRTPAVPSELLLAQEAYRYASYGQKWC